MDKMHIIATRVVHIHQSFAMSGGKVKEKIVPLQKQYGQLLQPIRQVSQPIAPPLL